MRISDWSSDVCSSDLSGAPTGSTTWSAGWRPAAGDRAHEHPTMSVIASRLDTRSDAFRANAERTSGLVEELRAKVRAVREGGGERARERHLGRGKLLPRDRVRSEEHTSELHSLMRRSYAVFCLKQIKFSHHRKRGA